MKTRILLLLVAIMMVSTVEAKESKEQPNSKWDYGIDNSEPISFRERGIKFFIFPDGEMDFDIHANDHGTTTEYYYKGNRNNGRGVAKGHHKGTKVVRDYRGRVIRVGRVFINYNYRGKISRVGSVFISYRRNVMSKVGGLRLQYDRYGNVRYIGSVKHRYSTGYYSSHYQNNYHNYYNDYFYNDYVYNFTDDFFDDNFFNDYEQFNEDNDFYYYRSKGKITKNKRGKKEHKQKMIKRKKDKKVTRTRTPKKVKIKR